MVRNQTISWESQQNIWTDTWAKIHRRPLFRRSAPRWPWPSGWSLSSGGDTVPSGSAQRPLHQASIYVGWKPHPSRVHPRPGRARPPSASAAQAGPVAFSAGPCGDSFKRSFLHPQLGLWIWISDKKGTNSPSTPSTSLTRMEHLLGQTKLIKESPNCVSSHKDIYCKAVWRHQAPRLVWWLFLL